MLGLGGGLIFGGRLLARPCTPLAMGGLGVLRSFASTKVEYTTLPPPPKRKAKAKPVKRTKGTEAVAAAPATAIQEQVNDKTSKESDEHAGNSATRAKRYMQEYYAKNREKMLEKNQANRKVRKKRKKKKKLRSWSDLSLPFRNANAFRFILSGKGQSCASGHLFCWQARPAAKEAGRRGSR